MNYLKQTNNYALTKIIKKRTESLDFQKNSSSIDKLKLFSPRIRSTRIPKIPSKCRNTLKLNKILSSPSLTQKDDS